MVRFFHWLLLCLPPELAHTIAVLGMRFLQRFCLFRIKKELSLTSSSPLLLTKDSISLSLRNRIGLAAGFDKNAEVFPSLAYFGFGFLELGTVTPLPQEGNPKPRLWRKRKDSVLINQMGFNNCGVDEFKKNISRYRSLCDGIVPLWLNIGKGKDTPIHSATKDYKLLFIELQNLADGFVINISSPNTKDLVSLQTVSFLEDLERTLYPIQKNSQLKKLPLFVKLSSDLELKEVEPIAIYVKDSVLFSGLILSNTSQKLAKEDYGFSLGGVSGKPIFEKSLNLIAQARKWIGGSKWIIGVGGVFDRASAITFRKAGADLIEIYTGFVYRGIPLLKELGRDREEMESL